jgi:hypothetical protein
MKRGISLIAVLMFMLAATTASVVIFRMLSSENFSSGARLKASEAYQASESGIDAVHSWLANRSAEAGDLVTQYVAKKQPIKINLGNMSGEKQQNFEAYVIGADVSGGNNKPVRLKILVKGKGREGKDSSVVTQTVILKVSGLYKANISPFSDMPEEEEEEKDGPPPPVGGSDNQTEACKTEPPPNQSSGQCDLPDLWGNMQTVGFIDARKMIITQSLTDNGTCNAGGQGINSIKIGTPQEPGYLILDGNFYVNNGLSIYGDLYADGEFHMCAKPPSDFITGNIYVKKFYPRVSAGTLNIGGSAYLDGLVDPNMESFAACGGGGGTVKSCSGQLGGKVKITGNTTINGLYSVYRGDGGGGNFDFDVSGNLVMGNSSYMDMRGCNANTTSKFEVQQNASIRKFSDADHSSIAKTSVIWPKFNGSSLCLGTSFTADGTDAGYNLYKDANSFYFKTKTTPSSCTADQSWNADPMDGTINKNKNYKEELSDNKTATKSCNKPPVGFDESHYIWDKVKTTSDKWAHRSNQLGKCNSSLFNEWSTLLTELNNCWTAAKAGKELYRDEWLVIYMTNNRFNTANGDLGNGKYIIIFDLAKKSENEYLYLPPTGPNAQVMLYFPNGFYGRIELSGNETNKIPQQSEYNYFIFSDNTIAEFNTTSARVLHGNVFMNNCAKINLDGYSHNPYFYSKGNDAFVDLLTGSGILYSTEHCKSRKSNSTPPATTYTLKCTPPPATGIEGDEIKKSEQPQITCEGSNSSGVVSTKTNCDFDWLDGNNPLTLRWNYLQKGTYNVKVKGNSGDCKDKIATCGTIAVSERPNTKLACKGLPKTGKVATAISKPRVMCGKDVLTSGFTFTSTPNLNWDNPVKGTYTVNVNVTSGTCSGKSEDCGTLTVKDIISFDEFNKEEPWIPISSRLSVKVESKEISKEKVPTDKVELEKSILVMPRIVRISEMPSNVTDKRQYIRNRYSYMYMNGAKKTDAVDAKNQLDCKSTSDPTNRIDLFGGSPQKDVYVCNFPTSGVKHSSFYVAVGAGVGPNNVADDVAECKLTGTNSPRYTHGKNIKLAIECKSKDDGSATNVVYESYMGGLFLAKDASGNYYYPGPEETDGAIISASGKCGSKDFDGILCFAEANGEKNYAIEVKRPTCDIPPGPYYSVPTGNNSPPYKSEPLVASPTHDCGGAAKYPAAGSPPKFNYTTDGTISRSDPGWNTWTNGVPNGHSFGTLGDNRYIRMYEISCDGHILNYGTRNDTEENIVCGIINVREKSGTGGGGAPVELPCEGNVSCFISYCKSNTSVPPPAVNCNTGSFNNPIFRYTETGDDSKLSKTTLSKWNSGENQTVSSTKKVYMQQVNCGTNTYKCGEGTDADKGLLCGSVEIKSNCSSNNVTATCKLVNKSNADVSTLTVTQGENIKAPKITCSNNETASNPNFSSTGSILPSGISNWPSGGNAYYTSATTPGDYTISVSVNCGQTILNDISCGTITVQKPKCPDNGTPATYTHTTGSSGCANNVPRPTYSCGNATGSDPKFEVKGSTSGLTGTNGWNGTGTEQSFCSARTNEEVRLYEVKCDGNTLTYFGTDKILCGYLTIVKSSSSAASSSSVASSSSASSGTTCAYQTSWCPNVNWTSGIKWSQAYSKPAANQCSCFFLDKVNGTTQPSCGAHSGATCTINSGDGGYYMYVCTGASGDPNPSNATTYKAKPSCTPAP